MFPSFRSFLAHFMRVGGVIEAEAVGVLGRPAVNMLITPSGQVKVESCVDLLVDDETAVIGSVYPMKSVPKKALVGAASAVAKELLINGYVGHFTVNFVAFDALSTGLRMAGTGIDPYFTNAAGMHKLMKFLCGEARSKTLSRR